MFKRIIGTVCRNICLDRVFRGIREELRMMPTKSRSQSQAIIPPVPSIYKCSRSSRVVPNTSAAAFIVPAKNKLLHQ